MYLDLLLATVLMSVVATFFSFEVSKKSKEHVLEVGLLIGADPNRYVPMIRASENAFTTGHEKWPNTLNDRYRTLTNWKREQSVQDCIITDGMSFGTDGVTTPGTGTGDGARR